MLANNPIGPRGGTQHRARLHSTTHETRCCLVVLNSAQPALTSGIARLTEAGTMRNSAGHAAAAAAAAARQQQHESSGTADGQHVACACTHIPQPAQKVNLAFGPPPLPPPPTAAVPHIRSSSHCRRHLNSNHSHATRNSLTRSHHSSSGRRTPPNAAQRTGSPPHIRQSERGIGRPVPRMRPCD